MKGTRIIALLSVTMLLLGLVACGGGGGGGGGGGPAVPTGLTPTVIGNSTFTRTVDTDGEWIIWEARLEQLLMKSGSRTVNLTAKLGHEFTLVDRNRSSGGENCFSYVAFDGRYAAFLADNVMDPDYFQVFYVDTAASGPKPVQISDGDIPNYDSLVVADGVVAWVNSADDVTVYDIASAAADTLGVTVSNGQLLVGGGYLLFVQSGEGVVAYEIATGTPVTMSGTDGNETQLTGGYDMAAFVDNGNIYCLLPGQAPAKATSTAGAPSNIAIGDGFIAYEEGGDIWSYNIGDPAGSVFAEETVLDPEEIAAGDGIIAFVDGEDIFVLTAGDGVAGHDTIVDDGTNITDRGVRVDGTTVYWVRDMNDLSECDPSSYVASWDTAAAAPEVTLLNEDYLRVWDPEMVGGKVVFSSRDANWGLYAQNVNSSLKPIALTPHQYNVAGDPGVVDGIAVFKALDRDNVADPGNGEDSMEVYYVDLNSSSKSMVRVTDNAVSEDYIQTDGKLIVYCGPNESGYYDASMYNIAADANTVLWQNPTQWYACYMGVGDGIVAWSTYNGGYKLYYYNTNDASPSVQTLLGDGSYYHPRVANGTMVWMGTTYSNGYPIYYHQIGDPLDSIGTITTAGNKPFFDGQTVTWRGSSDSLVWYYDMTDAVATSISGTEVYDYPHASGGLIFWGEDTDPEGDQEIYYYDLNAEAPSVMKLTDNDLWDCHVRFANGTLVYRTGGSNNWDWDGKIVAAVRQ